MIQKNDIIIAAKELIKNGETVSLDSVARTIGLTKAGLVHHFPTKKALMIGLIDNVAERWRTMLEEAPSKHSPEERMMTYLNYALSGEIDSSDFAFIVFTSINTSFWVLFTGTIPSLLNLFRFPTTQSNSLLRRPRIQ